jgi:quercetin dioxygenase-like cupin family protein
MELFGPTLEFLTSPKNEHNDFCVLMGTISPDVYVPLHSHPDMADFFLVISGAVECLRYGKRGPQVDRSKAGDYIRVPVSEEHAPHNVENEILLSTLLSRPNG